MTQLFISDLHLMEERPDITGAFFDFLTKTASDADTLFILGDFFEVWLGDDDESPFNRRVIEAVAALDADKYLMHGNRDFLMGEKVCEAMGATLLADPTVVDLYGRPALLMHGDSMCTRDLEYMEARRMLRDPAFQADLLSKSLEERRAIATGARKKSKEHTHETADDIMDVTQEEVVREMSRHGVDLMIHGHTHRPNRHEVTLGDVTGERIVLGDWDKNGWYLMASESGLDLVSFRISRHIT